MAALDLGARSPEHQPPVPGAMTTRRLEGTLVAPRLSKPVPNHLADTKIFSSSQRNGILQTKPSVVHFDGYQVGQVHQQTLQIINVSRDNQQMHIIPPTTPFFSIKYSKKRSSLVPGLSLDVTVQFKPKEWHYYYDCIRIHCKGEQNLLIPIHAYPILNTAKFPRHIKFLSTPIGQTRTKTVSLECDVPIQFEYQLTYLHSHPAFTVEPMNGVVPANGKVDIFITFTPAEYSTATIELQLELSQFNSNPLLCTVTGSSSPGLAADHLRQQTVKMTQQLKHQKLTLKSAPPHHLPPLKDDSSKPSQWITRKKSSKSSTSVTLKKEDDNIVQDGYRFPANMDNPGAIAKVLAQQPGKAKASELRQAVSQTSGADGGIASQQMKEAIFLQEVRQAVAEERANQLRWVTKLGGEAISDKEREAILNARKEAQSLYQQHLHHNAVSSKEYHHSSTECVRRRTRRKARQHSDHNPLFDPYDNDAWSRRYTALQRFVQAARKIIVQLRSQERLKKLQALASELKAGKSLKEMLPDKSDKESDIEELLAQAPPFNSDLINLSLFPEHKEEEERDEEGNLIVNGVTLKKVDVEPLVLEDYIKEKWPRLEPKEPPEYKIMGYTPLPFPELDSYRPPGLARKLKEGALEEYESLGPIPGVDPQFLTPDAFTSLPMGYMLGPDVARGPNTDFEPVDTEPKTKTLTKKLKSATGVSFGPVEVHVDEGEIKRPTQLLVQDIEGVREMERSVVALKPPAELFKSPQLHPLHIFYPAPGVTSYVPMLPHSEVSQDHALLPLPTYPSSKHPQVRLDSLSVIPGLMHWKQFPSHCLLAMDGEKKLSSVWKPRRTDPFSSDLLPVMDKPELLSGPQLDDFADLESTEVQPVPTMDMVRSQFHIPSTSARAPSIQLQHQSTTGDINILSLGDNAKSTHTATCDTYTMELGPDWRQLAEESLEEERRGQLNQLGSRVQERWNTYQELLGSHGRGTEEPHD